ncbi:MAG: hypothetical protein R6W78_12800 [Bacteroidales bacterium]
MDYAKDLLKARKKSKFAIVIGILLLLIAISWIPTRLIEKESISGFDWLYTFIFLLNGLSQTITGLGYSIDRLIGRAFIKIDNQVIKIKTGAFDREQSINWDQIDSINYKSGNFLITENDTSSYKLTITKLEYSIIQEIKNVINEISKAKKIELHLD